MQAQLSKSASKGNMHPIPVKKNRYEMYGIPQPNTTIKEEDRILAKDIITKDARKNVVIQYIREAPRVHQFSEMKVIKKAGKPAQQVERLCMKAVRGTPLGALVGFKCAGRVLVGWSKRNTKVKEVLKDGKPYEEPLEKLCFTKNDALEVATLRALSDTIVFDRDNKKVTAGSGTILPKSIEKVMPNFVNRVSDYFDQNIANIEK